MSGRRSLFDQSAARGRSRAEQCATAPEAPEAPEAFELIEATLIANASRRRRHSWCGDADRASSAATPCRRTLIELISNS
jgi:hypothetical protein